jgi:Ser/Thr protein kinase RdoA (MazF antagonist)
MKTKQTVEKIKDYFEKNRNNKKHVEKFIKDYLQECEDQITYFSEVLNNGLTTQLIHGDFNLSNIAFNENNEIATIFDFDEITLAPISFEIGCTLVHLDEGFMLLEDLVEYFVREYKRHNKLFDARETEASIVFMRYRSLYRISRYFTYYRFSDKAVEHYTKYQAKLDKYKKFLPNTF